MVDKGAIFFPTVNEMTGSVKELQKKDWLVLKTDSWKDDSQTIFIFFKKGSLTGIFENTSSVLKLILNWISYT